MTNTTNENTSTVVWTNCPIDVTGGISGSSYSEYFSLRVVNLTDKDIDSAKVLLSFNHTGYDNRTETITSVHTIDTIWSNSELKIVIPTDNYNFLKATIFPVCVYFKDGSKWGDSTASYDTLLKYTRPFYIEHFAMGDFFDDNKSEDEQLGMLPEYGEDGSVIEEWYYEEPDRDLDGIDDYFDEVDISDPTEENEPAE